MEELLNKINALQETAGRFHVWLKAQFQQFIPPEENIPLQERTIKAAEHFIQEINTLIGFLQKSPAVTDSRLQAKEYNDSLKEIFAELSAKKFLLPACSGKFDVEAWHKRKKNFVLPLFTINAYAGAAQQKTESAHPYLHLQLRKLRDAICSKKDLPIYIVAGSRTIDEMARYLPQTLAELRKISGFGDAKIEQYGQQFLEIILEYCGQNNLPSLIHEKLPKRERKQSNDEKKPKVDTKAESFKLFKQGMTVAEIAATRKYTIQTIEGHLSHYVSQGEINIEEIVSKEKILLIEPVIRTFEGGPIALIKEKLGNSIGFGEIRLVLAWQEFQKNK
jgi:hypothetical protein